MYKEIKLEIMYPSTGNTYADIIVGGYEYARVQFFKNEICIVPYPITREIARTLIVNPLELNLLILEAVETIKKNNDKDDDEFENYIRLVS